MWVFVCVCLFFTCKKVNEYYLCNCQKTPQNSNRTTTFFPVTRISNKFVHPNVKHIKFSEDYANIYSFKS